MKPVAFASIGECMVELSAGNGALWRMGFAGDTFNAAWYARAILPRKERVAYVTAIGDDPLSKRMRTFISDAGLETDRLREIRGRHPGLYAITLNDAERTFTYWRGESAARLLADDPEWLGRALGAAGMLYFSGITLAILAPASRRRLLSAIAERRKAGTKIAFDPNYRSALWPDKSTAQRAVERALQAADVALPTTSEMRELFGDRSEDRIAARLVDAGVGEFVLKNGERPALVFGDGKRGRVPPTTPKRLVDTTGAGDSFSGAYLAGRLMRLDPFAAARLGHAVAAEVVGVYGALVAIDGAKALRKARGRRSGLVAPE